MPAPDLHDRFLKHLPRIEAHARFAFRRVGCAHARADQEAETIELAWREFLRLIARGNPRPKAIEPKQADVVIELKRVKSGK